MQCCLAADLEEDDQEVELDKIIAREFVRATQLVADPARWRAIIALSDRLAQNPFEMTGEEAMRIIDAELDEIRQTDCPPSRDLP
jgi:hypothetical protein